MTHIFKFRDSSITREQVKLRISNLACTLSNNAKLGHRESVGGQVTYFRNYGTLYISREQPKQEISNLVPQCKMPIPVTTNRSNRNRK